MSPTLLGRHAANAYDASCYAREMSRLACGRITMAPQRSRAQWEAEAEAALRAYKVAAFYAFGRKM